ncbi:MAG: DUF3343 domain-containing protein [Synergistaceae bacterium]
MKCFVSFDTTHSALAFEKTFRSLGYQVKIVPVPREISASCGLACSYPCELESEVKSIVEERGLEFSEFHKV